jgi:hypothetical protein
MQHVRPVDKDRLEWDFHLLLGEEPPTTMFVPGSIVYATVQLDKQQVQRVWPRKSLWAQLTRQSPVERTGDKRMFAHHDKYYRDNLGFTPAPLKALFG